ncbi:hypothetical protein, partial [Escherichia coli]|uniref:hypothetical protein n=1 Tax=Escherichia coli TaxID=562 RepID=UPI000DDD9250
PESITDLPLVARHTSPSEIIILYYLTIPFGIGSKKKTLNAKTAKNAIIQLPDVRCSLLKG